MSDTTGIEWTDATWNPVRGCSRVSAGCMRCYAERQAIRQIGGAYAGLIQRTSHGPAWTGEIRVVPKLLDQPLRWKKPRHIFVNSMSDLFHEAVPSEFICAVFGVMALTPHHTYQVLTKRPDRMRSWLSAARSAPFLYNREHPGYDRITRQFPNGYPETSWPLPNVWLGVSVEDQATADERIPLLLQTPAAVRFVSYEPALGPVDFRGKDAQSSALDPYGGDPKLDWVIVGGESGPKARACNIAWIRFAVEQCKAAHVAVFVKQLGAHPEFDQGCGDCDPCIGGGKCCVCAVRTRLSLNDRQGGEMAEWPEDLRVREFPQ